MLNNFRRIVVKVGSQLLSEREGIDEKFVKNLAEQISTLVKSGKEVVLVSSGAVLSGAKALKLNRKFFPLQQKQALSAIGQPYLMAEYRKAFKKHGVEVAQVLITAEDLRSKERFVNTKNTLNALMKFGALPIVNENDTVSVEEIKIGDNDNLSAHVSVVFDADLLIMLTVTNGVYDKDPTRYSDAKPIPVVESLEELHNTCKLSGKSCFGTGGMWTKVEAAAKASKKGIPVIIAGGKEKDVILRILKGENMGTLFIPAKKLRAKGYRILYLMRPNGKLYIDDGAVKAIVKKGKSLLSKGLSKVEGEFRKGDVVEILDTSNNLIGKGIVRCSSNEISSFRKTCVHRNDLVILKEKVKN